MYIASLLLAHNAQPSLVVIMYPRKSFGAYYAVTKTWNVWLDVFFLPSLRPHSHVNAHTRKKTYGSQHYTNTRTTERTHTVVWHAHTHARIHIRKHTHTHLRTHTHALLHTYWLIPHGLLLLMLHVVSYVSAVANNYM